MQSALLDVVISCLLSINKPAKELSLMQSHENAGAESRQGSHSKVLWGHVLTCASRVGHACRQCRLDNTGPRCR